MMLNLFYFLHSNILFTFSRTVAIQEKVSLFLSLNPAYKVQLEDPCEMQIWPWLFPT